MDATFGYGPENGEAITATCGTSNKTATFNVIVPSLNKLVYSGSYDVYGGTESWVSGGANDPSCWKKWLGATRSGGVGTTCYAPSGGGATAEGTYAQICSGLDTGFGLVWGDAYDYAEDADNRVEVQ